MHLRARSAGLLVSLSLASTLFSVACDSSGGLTPILFQGGPGEAVATPLPPEPEVALDAVPQVGHPKPPARRGPPYPMVLAHGWTGFREIGPIEYFWQVADTLRSEGFDAYVGRVDPYNSSYVRGEQLLRQVRRILEDTGADKVNILGHSQGGLDARYVAHFVGDRIGAVVSYSTPHQGAVISEVALGNMPGWSQDAAEALFNLMGAAVFGFDDSNVRASIEQFSRDGMREFNAVIADDPRVRYYSLAGRSNGVQFNAPGCEADDAPDFINRWNRYTDPTNLFIIPLALAIDPSGGKRVPNDGVSQVEGSAWGRYLGCVPADHLNQIGHLFGTSPGLDNEFDYLVLFRDLAWFLVEEGF